MRGVSKLAAGLAGLITISWVCGSGAAEPAAKNATVSWQSDLKAAQKQSIRTGRPMLIVFGADWCTHCGRFERNTLNNPTMAGYINREFVAVHLDFDKQQETAEVLEVEALPCTVILSPEADLLGKVVGAKAPKDYWEVLQDAKDEQARIRQTRFASGSSADRK
ncbi:MAG: thioredoxin family protein [Planctomycetota bacterium]|nr:thioredoxin family protein [Planctomycetaceae bacterium]MDQ3329239.1 thioredoxin family protein [Planctomycetota bacterium]